MSENLTPDSVSGVDSLARIRPFKEKPPLLMGILNITPDSFYSNSRYSLDDAIQAAKEMISQGASWIDVGGESTRRGAEKISIEQEIERVIPVIKQLTLECPGVNISIDTRNHEVARQAILNGAKMVNDVSGLRDEKMCELILETGCAVCIMHMQGEPSSMQNNPSYHNVVDEVTNYLCKMADYLVALGHPKEKIVIDPGIGFGKTQQDNLMLMKSISQFKSTGYAVLWGISRKSIIGYLTSKSDANDRLAGTLASSSFAAENGVDILRVHDIDEHCDFFKVYSALQD